MKGQWPCAREEERERESLVISDGYYCKGSVVSEIAAHKQAGCLRRAATVTVRPPSDTEPYGKPTV